MTPAAATDETITDNAVYDRSVWHPCCAGRAPRQQLPSAQQVQDRVQLRVEAVKTVVSGGKPLTHVGEPGVDLPVNGLQQLVQRIDVGTLLPHLALDLR